MTDHNDETPSPIFSLHADRPVELSPLEQQRLCALLDDIAALCEVAGLAHQLKDDTMLAGYAARLKELRRINREALPAQRLDAQQLGIFTGGRVPHLFDQSLQAATDGAKLNVSDSAGRAELIRRVAEDTRAVIDPVTTFLQKSGHGQYGLYYAQQIIELMQDKHDTHAPATSAGALKLPDILDVDGLDLTAAFDGRTLYQAVNAALAAHNLAPEKSPYPAPPRRVTGKPQLRVL